MLNVAIIGAGIGGLMTAYKLKMLLSNNVNVTIIEKGNTLDKRNCPAKKGLPCTHCDTCSIVSGIAGAGAFSDGKFNLGTAYGGTLGDELGEETTMRYINELDDFICSLMPTLTYPTQVYGSNEEISKKCLANNLRLLDMNVRHLGTDLNLTIMTNLVDKLTDFGVKIVTNTEVTKITKISSDEKRFFNLTLNRKNSSSSMSVDKVVLAVGRNGTPFLTNYCQENGIHMKSNAVDIGVRVEMKDAVWDDISSKIYEPKITFRTPTFEDRTRMFCFNKGGLVSAENNGGVITANGHAYSDPSKRTDNCNFAILSSIHFTEPFNKPTEYARYISSLANMIGDGNVLVQRFGDLIRGRRTNEHRLSQNTVHPTLNAVPGDISLVLPHRILTNIIETIYALDKIAPGTANDDTLLYGCESKYYSVRPNMNKSFEIEDGCYVVGDGSGICRGLSQSGAMGMYVAERIAHQ